MSKYHVGQEVTYFSQPGRGVRTTITRMGRRWGYVEVYHREIAFDLETGQGKSDRGFGDWISTDEELTEKQARAEAMARVKPLRETYGGAWQNLTVDEINRIADIIEEQA